MLVYPPLPARGFNYTWVPPVSTQHLCLQPCPEPQRGRVGAQAALTGKRCWDEGEATGRAMLPPRGTSRRSGSPTARGKPQGRAEAEDGGGVGCGLRRRRGSGRG